MTANTKTPTTPENLERINGFCNSIVDLMCYLYGRWQDEKDFEDINDYAAPIIPRLPEGFAIVKMTKRPFGFVFTIGTDAAYQMVVSARRAGWNRIG